MPALTTATAATCFEDRRKKFKQEVIEFPTVFIDVATGEVAAEFHQYVKPRLNPQLSEFCTELTGIEQATVDAGKYFEEVLKDHEKFVTEHGFLGKCLYVTCGDWVRESCVHGTAFLPGPGLTPTRFVMSQDLERMLPSQCLLISPELEPPKYLQSWLNIKFAYEAVTGRSRQIGMAGMLRDLNMELLGKHHSGIDDCRNIGRIAMQLLSMEGGRAAVHATNSWKGWTKKQARRRAAQVATAAREKAQGAATAAAAPAAAAPAAAAAAAPVAAPADDDADAGSAAIATADASA